jgi:hypothetical protein
MDSNRKAQDTETNNKGKQTGHMKTNTSKTRIYLDDDDDDKLFVLRYHHLRHHFARMFLNEHTTQSA